MHYAKKKLIYKLTLYALLTTLTVRAQGFHNRCIVGSEIDIFLIIKKNSKGKIERVGGGTFN